MKKRIGISFACALALSVTLGASEDLGIITVDSSTIDDKFQIANTDVSNVAVIDGEEIEKINPQNVADILNKIPGITFSNTGTDMLKVHIRGIDNQMYMGEKPGVAIIIDGVPVQETSGKINVDLDNIASIKIIKGGASYLYGNDAISGAVVITTKRPKGESSSKIETEAGSFGTTRILASTNQSFENSALQLQASNRDSDGYWDDAYMKVKSINGKYQYYLNDNSDITFGLDYTDRKTGDGNSVSGTTMAEADPESSSEYSYSGYYDTTLTKTFITYSNDLDDKSNFMLRVHKYEDDKSNKTARFTTDKSEIWDQSGAKGEYRTSFDKLAVMAGFDIQRNETDELAYDVIDGTAPRGGTDGDLLDNYHTGEDINALYTELKHQTTEDLITTFNLRYDNIEHNYIDNEDTANNVAPSYDVASYRLGANYNLSKINTLYTSISTGFRTPTVGQTSTNQVALAADPTLDIPSIIDMETTYNYELGIRGKNSEVTYDASIYQLDRKDYIGKIAGNYITSDDEDESNYDNIGDMRSRGLEISLSSNIKENISYSVAYTYLDAIYTSYIMNRQITEDTDTSYTTSNAIFEKTDLSGNIVPRTSKHTVNLTLDYQVTNRLSLSPELIIKSSYYADEINLNKQKGYEVVNLRGTYKLNKDLEFFAKIDNVLDTNYYQFVNLSSSAIATMEDDATIRVAPPRAYYAGLRYKF